MKGRRGEAASYFQNTVLRYEGDECLFWPYSKNSHGYGQLRIGGETKSVHRLVCEDFHGAPPSPQHDAAHSCGNGHLACCNPRHLSWQSRKENLADRERHGTMPRGRRNARSKLTERDVHEIRVRSSSESAVSLGRAYDISNQSVGAILHGKTWGWLADRRK